MSMAFVHLPDEIGTASDIPLEQVIGHPVSSPLPFIPRDGSQRGTTALCRDDFDVVKHLPHVKVWAPEEPSMLAIGERIGLGWNGLTAGHLLAMLGDGAFVRVVPRLDEFW
jgi:hypothetical protein